MSLRKIVFRVRKKRLGDLMEKRMLFMINKLVSNIIWTIDLRLAKWKSYKLRKLEDKIRRKTPIAYL